MNSKDYRPKPMSYTINMNKVTVNNLRDVMVTLHLNHLHNTQLDMIDEAVLKSDMSDAKEVLKYIMEK